MDRHSELVSDLLYEKEMINTVRTLLICLGVVLCAGGCAAVDTASAPSETWPDSPPGPWEKVETPLAPAAEGWDEASDRLTSDERGSTAGIFDLGYRFYVQGLTQVDGPRCEHRPTCSRYSYQAVRKHGMVIGSFLAVDRLMRGNRSSAIRRLPIYRVYQGSIYYHDPVESNDFFL